TITATRPAGFVAQRGARCTIGPRLRRVSIACTDPATQVAAGATLTIVADTDARANAAATFGFYAGVASARRTTRVDELADDVASKTRALDVSKRFTPAVFPPSRTLFVRSSPVDPTTVELFAIAGVGDTLFLGATLTLASAVSLPDVRAGDVLVLRS